MLNANNSWGILNSKSRYASKLSNITEYNQKMNEVYKCGNDLKSNVEYASFQFKQCLIEKIKKTSELFFIMKNNPINTKLFPLFEKLLLLPALRQRINNIDNIFVHLFGKSLSTKPVYIYYYIYKNRVKIYSFQCLNIKQ